MNWASTNVVGTTAGERPNINNSPSAVSPLSMTLIRINIIIISLSATVIGLLLIAMGIGIKFYLDKVRNKLIQNEDQFRLTFKLNYFLKKKNELEKLLNGDPDRIDPDVPMEYQTIFLPYDKKWEFPRKRLRLGLFFFLINFN
jgi:hypothetical protein